jgi:hypothetical protein
LGADCDSDQWEVLPVASPCRVSLARISLYRWTVSRATTRCERRRTRAGEGGEEEPCGPRRRGWWGSGRRGCGSLGEPGALVPPSSSGPEWLSSSRAIIAESERNGIHNIKEATTSLTSPINANRSHSDIPSDATTVCPSLQLRSVDESDLCCHSTSEAREPSHWLAVTGFEGGAAT